MTFSLKKYGLFVAIGLAFFVQSCALRALPPTSPVDRVDPPFWWTGMKNDTLELTLHGSGLGAMEVSLRSDHTTILGIYRPANPDYLFLTLLIGEDQQAGDLVFTLTPSGSRKRPSTFTYSLRERTAAPSRGISPSDLIYLVFPDRYANGDPGNDVVEGMNETVVDRTALKGRHGGDLRGIRDHLGDIADLGVTALWLNPILENDQPKESYHGYAATDLYRVDPRLGTNEEFRALVQECHAKGIRIIWDVVYNHWGNEHHLYQDLPDSNWVHRFPQFTRTSYRAETLLDPYASEYDKQRMSDAWFDHHMPDLDQTNPQLARYLIQNSIWWIEYAGIDAFRIDTYAYPDQRFMKRLNEAVRAEYPDFVLFGETWVQGSPVQAWFTEANGLNKSFSSSLQGVTDFQFYFAVTKGLNEAFGWEEGFRRIELTFTHDILYADPYMNVTFLDNHDLSRFYSVVNEDFSKWKMGMAMLYTMRGIPCIYYGTEILMKNYANPDALVREDFPGGWPGDPVNLFEPQGRKGLQQEAYQFTRVLGNWRKYNEWLGRSRMVQFVPEDNTYVYFRLDDGHTVMCVYSLNDKEVSLKLDRFSECLRGRSDGFEVISGTRVELKDQLTLAPRSVMVIEVK